MRTEIDVIDNIPANTNELRRQLQDRYDQGWIFVTMVYDKIVLKRLSQEEPTENAPTGEE